MNEFCEVSAKELDHVEGGFGLIPALVARLLDATRLPDLEEPGEVLPGFDAFLAETQRISGIR
jgi:bacteriocin-like protein